MNTAFQKEGRGGGMVGGKGGGLCEVLNVLYLLLQLPIPLISIQKTQ